MATSSGHLSSVFAHGHHSNLTPSIVRSSNAGILSSDLISHHGVSVQANHHADPLHSVKNSSDGGNIQRVQQIPGSIRGLDEFDDDDESLCLVNEDLDDIIANDITATILQMAGPLPAPSFPSHENCVPITQQSVPSNIQQLCPTISPPPNTNLSSPKKTKARRRWTLELHDRFIDAVKQLGGSKKATPKAILGIMKVEGLTRDEVKSHLQKYKLAQAKHHPSEGTSSDTTMPTEVVQISIEAFALRVQMELQKELHDMVEKTRSDLVEIQNRLLQLETRQNLLMSRTTSHLSSPAAAAALLTSSSAAAPEDHSTAPDQGRMAATGAERWRCNGT